MTTHPAVKSLKREVEALCRKADELQQQGFSATAYNYRQMSEGVEHAIAVVQPHLEENES